VTTSPQAPTGTTSIVATEGETGATDDAGGSTTQLDQGSTGGVQADSLAGAEPALAGTLPYTGLRLGLLLALALALLVAGLGVRARRRSPIS
jgi:hypothetical protein